MYCIVNSVIDKVTWRCLSFINGYYKFLYGFRFILLSVNNCSVSETVLGSVEAVFQSRSVS